MRDGAALNEAAARAAGWRRSEIWWERLQARAKTRQIAGDVEASARCWMLAHGLGLLCLSREDPRFACGLANAAAAARHRGRLRTAEVRHRRACELWRSVPAWVERIRPAPRARSSLFHLRLARRHADIYRENLQAKLREHVQEATSSLEANTLEAPGAKPRWIRERPPVFDDTRRLLSACYLMAYVAPVGLRAGRDATAHMNDGATNARGASAGRTDGSACSGPSQADNRGCRGRPESEPEGEAQTESSVFEVPHRLCTT